MPLKDVDLKTFEAYKKAIRQDVTKITDTSKTKFWVYKDIELPNLTGKKQKILAFVALVDDMGIRNFLRGKKLVCMGTCHLEQAKVAFEPIKGKVPFNHLKISVPLFLGKPLYIPANASPEDEADDAIEDDAEQGHEEKPSIPPAPPTPLAPPSSPESGLLASWTKLQTQMQAAIAAIPARKDSLSRAAAGIPDLIKANNVKEATAKMNEVQAILAAPPPPPPGGDLLIAWGTLSKDVQAAVAANPARKDALSQAAAGIPDFIKANNAAEARKRMEALRQMLASPPAGSPDVAALKAAWGSLVPKIKATGNAALNQAMVEGGKQLNDLVGQRKLVEAQAVIDRLTTQLNQLKPAAAAKLAPSDITAAWQKLVPEVEQKSRLHPELKDAAVRVRKQVQELTAAGKFDAAKQAIDDLAELLRKTSDEAPKAAVKPESASTEDPKKAEYLRKRELMDKDILRALKERIGDVSKIRAAVALAEERSEGGDYASALKVLASLDTLLRESETDDDDMPAAGLVEYRKKLAAFDSVRRRAQGQIDQLVAAIPNTLPEETDLADELADEFGEEMEELQELIDDAVNAANDAKAPIDSALKSKIQEAAAEIETSKLIRHAEKNTFGVTFDFRESLAGALKQILEAIPVAV